MGLQLWRADLGLEHPGIWWYAGGTWNQPPKIRMIVLLLLLLFDAVTIFMLQSGER